MNRDAAIAALVDAATKLLDAAAALDALDELVPRVERHRDVGQPRSRSRLRLMLTPEFWERWPRHLGSGVKW